MYSFKVFTLPLFGKNDFAGYRIIGLKVFFSYTFKMLLHFFWRALIVKKLVAMLIPVYRVMTHLMMGIPSEKCIVRQFCYCVNVIEYTYTNLDGITYYPLRLCAIPLLNVQLIIEPTCY